MADPKPIQIVAMPPAARFSLRIAPEQAGAITAAISGALPLKVGERASLEGGEALCLGPDEWVVVVAPEAAARIIAASADIMNDAPHSLVDISDREVSLQLSGTGVVDLLSVGYPRDPRRFVIGTGHRTLFDDVPAVLWRDAEDSFRLDVWRSFLPHVVGLLEASVFEIATEAPAQNSTH